MKSATTICNKAPHVRTAEPRRESGSWIGKPENIGQADMPFYN